MNNEIKTAGILAGIGLVLVAIYAVMNAGPNGLMPVLFAVVLALAIQVVLGIVALYIAAALLGIGFGDGPTAAAKLAAIFLLPGAVSLFLPGGVDWLVATAMYLIMLMIMLDLEHPVEIIVCVIVIALVRMVAVKYLVPAVTGVA